MYESLVNFAPWVKNCQSDPNGTLFQTWFFFCFPDLTEADSHHKSHLKKQGKDYKDFQRTFAC